MKRLILLVGVILITISLSGCTGFLRDLFMDDYKETEKMAQQIVEALDAQDEDALRSLFTKEALAEADDFHEGFVYTLSQYNGQESKLDTQGASSIKDSYGTPGRTKKADAHFILETAQGKYYLYFEYWIINEVNPASEGLTYIKLADYEEEMQNRGPRDRSSYDRYGIYNPSWKVIQNEEE
jgi:hypothetical protein